MTENNLTAETVLTNKNENTSVFLQVATIISFILIVPLVYYIIKMKYLSDVKQKLKRTLDAVDLELAKSFDTIGKILDSTEKHIKFDQQTNAKIDWFKNLDPNTHFKKKFLVSMEVTEILNNAIDESPFLRTLDNVNVLMSFSNDTLERIVKLSEQYNRYAVQFNDMISSWPINAFAKTMKLWKLPYIKLEKN